MAHSYWLIAEIRLWHGLIKDFHLAGHSNPWYYRFLCRFGTFDDCRLKLLMVKAFFSPVLFHRPSSFYLTLKERRLWKEMARKMKEDEKMERAIRSLLKLPENRRCINCNSIVCRSLCSLLTWKSRCYWSSNRTQRPDFIGFFSCFRSSEPQLMSLLSNEFFVVCEYAMLNELFDEIFNLLLLWAGATICLHNLLDIYLHKLQWDTVSWIPDNTVPNLCCFFCLWL